MTWFAGATPAQSPAAAKKKAPASVSRTNSSAAKSTVKSTSTKKSPVRPAAATAARRAAKPGTKSKRTVVARRPSQQQPTVDRYKEIQQSLADKGYFPGTVDGNWGPGSVDALKRFQKDQNLDSDGKIGALSLMALGLGPKRGRASAQSFAAPGAKDAPAVQSEPVDPPPVALPEP